MLRMRATPQVSHFAQSGALLSCAFEGEQACLCNPQ
jgi:hypothetical protein